MYSLTEVLDTSPGISLDSTQPRYFRVVPLPVYDIERTQIPIYTRETAIPQLREFQTEYYAVTATVPPADTEEHAPPHLFKEGYDLSYQPDTGSYRFEIMPPPAVDFDFLRSLPAEEREHFVKVLKMTTPQLIVRNDFDNPHDLDVRLFTNRGTDEVFRTNSNERWASCLGDFTVWFEEKNEQNFILAEYKNYLRAATSNGLDLFIARLKAIIPEPNLGTQKQFEELAKRAQTSRVPIRDVTSLIPAHVELVPFASF